MQPANIPTGPAALEDFGDRQPTALRTPGFERMQGGNVLVGYMSASRGVPEADEKRGRRAPFGLSFGEAVGRRMCHFCGRDYFGQGRCWRCGERELGGAIEWVLNGESSRFPIERLPPFTNILAIQQMHRSEPRGFSLPVQEDMLRWLRGFSIPPEMFGDVRTYEAPAPRREFRPLMPLFDHGGRIGIDPAPSEDGS